MKKDMNRRYLMLHDTAAYLKEKGVPGTGLDSAGVCFSLRVPLDDLLIPCMLVYEPRESGADIARIDCDLSSVAGKSAGMHARELLADLLRKMGAVLVAEKGFGHALGKEEFQSDQLRLTADEKMELAMEANRMILGLNGF